MDTASQTQARIVQAQEREDHLRHLREQKAVEQIFESSPVKFKVSNADVLKTIGTIRFDADGVPIANGVQLSVALENVGMVNPQMVAGTWQEHHRPESQIRSKADLKTVADKVEYIKQFGEMQFARLPQTAPVELDETKLTFEQYRSLPVSVKTKLVEKYGYDFSAKLRAVDAEQQRYDRLVGVPIGTRRA